MDILDFWFENPNNWIQTDKELQYELDNKIYDLFYLKYCDILFNNLSLTKPLSTIILFDQLTRHLCRIDSDLNQFIMGWTKKAYEISLELIHSDLVYDYEPNELIFILMPIKHFAIKKEGNLILETIHNYCHRKSYENLNSEPLKHLNRFFIDTYKKFYCSENIIPTLVDCSYVPTETTLDCLENIPPNFLTNPDIYLDKMSKVLLNKLEMKILRILIANKISKDVFVSLSGGVDSMTILFILNRLKKKYDIIPHAFHLTYNNRSECSKEYEIIKWYCNLLNTPLYNFEIKYITRRFSDRDFYETITRDIRFECYRKLTPKSPIMLGHIKDDVVENIWTNLAHGRDIFYLRKMSISQEMLGVHLIRPLLDTFKSEILEYAKFNSIPWTLNTTPSWSNRGKMRERFHPLTLEMFGSDVDNHLLFFSDTLTEYKSYLDTVLFTPFQSNWFYNHASGELKSASNKLVEYSSLGVHFWQTVMIDLFHNHFSSHPPSRRSIETMVDTLKTKTNRTLPIMKGYSCSLDFTRNTITIYRD